MLSTFQKMLISCCFNSCMEQPRREVPRSGRAQKEKKGKNRTFVFHFLANCTKYGQTNCQKVVFLEKKSFRSRIVGQKCQKKKILRMGLPGTQNLSQLHAIILMLSRASQLPYN